MRASITVLKSKKGDMNTSRDGNRKRRSHNSLGHVDTYGRELSAKKTDIVIKDHANRCACCKLIDVSVPSDRNTSTKVIEKLSKYKDLDIESTRMWGMRTEIVPVIVGALGLIREGMDQNLGKISGASNINELQKIIILGTVHIPRFLSIK